MFVPYRESSPDRVAQMHSDGAAAFVGVCVFISEKASRTPRRGGGMTTLLPPIIKTTRVVSGITSPRLKQSAAPNIISCLFAVAPEASFYGARKLITINIIDILFPARKLQKRLQRDVLVAPVTLRHREA